MHTLVVIVNYRTADLTVDCLRSLEPEVRDVSARFGPTKVVVTDNASGDDSPDKIEAAIEREGWSAWASLQRLPRNGGFAYGNNEAIRPALAGGDPPEFVWLLNPDTVVRPNALSALIDFLADRREIGLAGSRLEDPDGTPQRSAFRFPSVASEMDAGLRFGPVTSLVRDKVVAYPVPSEAEPADWVAGASVLVRRQVFEQIGLMDEGYFMYFEEVDFCLRAYRAGWPCWYVPESRVVHLVGQASGVTSKATRTRRRPAYWFESRRRYWLKNGGALPGAAADALHLGGFALWRLRRLLQRKPDGDPAHFLGDLARNSVFRRGFRLG